MLAPATLRAELQRRRIVKPKPPFVYIRNRIIFLAVVLLLAVFTSRALFPPEAPTIRRVQATVIEINRGEGKSFRSGGTAVMTTARVRLPDQTETRVLVTGQLPELGQVIELSELRYADGSLRYRVPSVSF